ncbi:hypothetical protein [Pantoea sp. GM_Pan_4]|uniref:glycine-rich domain-containing protein n=1 Tax=Pantoea sp. GM_Pan_4 TaxID=2937389 RepID=UPI00226AAD1A|nr:hypothetical protein [Pantoea sp. GM_Pan_4]
MATNNFKAFGIGAGANVTSQADYEALAALLTGFQSGKASSAQINKALRQSSTMAYVLAQFISDSTSVDVLDNGVPATILANLKAAMTSLTPGRLLNIQVFTSSGTYTKTPGTKKARVKSLGGGGAGGGTEVTTSAQIAAAWGGNSGAYAESSLIDVSSVASVAVTIGAAGIPATGAAGGAGGQSSFGSYLITPGGAGGLIGSAGSGVSAGVDMDTGSNPSGSALAFGTPASVGVGPLSLSATVGQATMKSGRGADSKLGIGGGGIRGANTAKSAFGYGAGGGGSAVGPSAAATTAGGVGTSGIIIVEEYA